jgi:hypothetical protein
MRTPIDASTVDLLEFLGRFQSGLAAQSENRTDAAVLKGIANRADHIAARLKKPTAKSWRAFLNDVELRADGDKVKDFLYSGDGCQIDSVSFLAIMTRIVLEHAEYQEKTLCR